MQWLALWLEPWARDCVLLGLVSYGTLWACRQISFTTHVVYVWSEDYDLLLLLPGRYNW